MLYAKDLQGMAEFYGAVLGLKAVAETRSEVWVEFECGFALHAIPAEIARGIEILSPPRARENTPIKLTFEVQDLESERKRLEALGVIFVASRKWGCDALDPEGNVFQLCAPE